MLLVVGVGVTLTLRLVSLTMRVLLLVAETHGRGVRTVVARTTASSTSNDCYSENNI